MTLKPAKPALIFFVLILLGACGFYIIQVENEVIAEKPIPICGYTGDSSVSNR